VSSCIDRYKLLFLLLNLLLISSLFGIVGNSLELSNHFNLGAEQTWLEGTPDSMLKLMWQPEIDIELMGLDFVTSAQFYTMPLQDSASMGSKLYRLWSGIDAGTWSIRTGLQRLNFGTAQVIRPLQWFDRIDPLDESQETEGVVSSILNIGLGEQAGLKLWAMVKGDKIYGAEIFQSQGIETGGRLDFPLSILNLGLSYHHRNLLETTILDEGSEDRYGLDLRYDGAIGVWTETSWASFDLETVRGLTELTLASVIGTDYTIGIGNGLYIMQETGLWQSSPDTFGDLTADKVATSILASYPLGLIDKLQALAMLDWTEETQHLTLQYSRVYDYWSIDFSIGQQLSKDAYPALRLSISYDI